MQQPTYEEDFNPITRRIERVRRAAAWQAKGLTGAERHILVELRWRLGDEIMAIPIYEALRTIYAPCTVNVLCNYPDLLEGNPHVDRVNQVPPQVDRYILLRSDARNVTRTEHYARLCHAPTPATRPALHLADWQTPHLDGLSRPVVALCSGASWATKCWPIVRWRDLARQLADDGCSIVELGKGDEFIGIGKSLVGQTTVREAACVLRGVNLMICGDSGLMHLALAVGTPTIAMFGPTDPSMLVINDPNLSPILGGCDQQGCWNRWEQAEPGKCPLAERAPETGARCMEAITVGTVFARAQTILRRQRENRA